MGKDRFKASLHNTPFVPSLYLLFTGISGTDTMNEVPGKRRMNNASNSNHSRVNTSARQTLQIPGFGEEIAYFLKYCFTKEKIAQDLTAQQLNEPVSFEKN